MIKRSILALACLSCCVPTLSAAADERVKRIDCYVEPFYNSKSDKPGIPQVAVGKAYNALLASDKKEDILAARDLVTAKPQLVTPMVMMALAIRCYDVGLRDESVLWFYVAKERAFTMQLVLDMKSPELSEAKYAIIAFAQLAGGPINGYAFCDLKKQKEAKEKAVAWSEANPYEALFLEKVPALPGDRKENWKKAVAASKERMKKEQEYFDDPKNVAEFKKAREDSGTNKRYCWDDEK